MTNCVPLILNHLNLSSVSTMAKISSNQFLERGAGSRPYDHCRKACTFTFTIFTNQVPNLPILITAGGQICVYKDIYSRYCHRKGCESISKGACCICLLLCKSLALHFHLLVLFSCWTGSKGVVHLDLRVCMFDMDRRVLYIWSGLKGVVRLIWIKGVVHLIWINGRCTFDLDCGQHGHLCVLWDFCWEILKMYYYVTVFLFLISVSNHDGVLILSCMVSYSIPEALALRCSVERPQGRWGGLWRGPKRRQSRSFLWTYVVNDPYKGEECIPVRAVV